jgi:quinol monooxygenase YgiN
MTSTDGSSELVVLWIELHVKPENREQFILAARENATRSSQEEEGVLRFDFLEDARIPNTFYYYEVYANEDAHQAHNRTPHRLRYGQAVEGLIEQITARRAGPVWTNYA